MFANMKTVLLQNVLGAPNQVQKMLTPAGGATDSCHPGTILMATIMR